MQAIMSFCTMQLQLASVFFTFSLGTRTHYFGRIILHGGAKVSSSFYILAVLAIRGCVLFIYLAFSGVTI